MHFLLLSTLGLAILASASLDAQASSSQEQATQFALLLRETNQRANKYGYPLVPYAQLAVPILRDGVSNKFQHTRDLPIPDKKLADFPPVDTLSSTVIIDLAATDIIVDIPSMSDRFWVFSFYDVYGDNYANLGVVGGSSAGKYRVAYRPANPGTGPGGVLDGYKGWVYSPTPYGVLVARLQLKDNGSDVDAIHQLQDKMVVTKPALGNIQVAPTLSVELLNSGLSGDPNLASLQLTCRLSSFNPPNQASDVAWVSSVLRLAGCSHGQFNKGNQVDLPTMAEQANATMEKLAQNSQKLIDLKNGWQIFQSQMQGKYASNYVIRAYFAHSNYLAMDTKQALYPVYSDGNKDLSLGLYQAYLLTFSSKPPKGASGFWSLTTYGFNFDLIANPLNQFSLGSSSKLTYPDGTPVYGGSDTKDGKFQILVQSPFHKIPSNWTSNWLPGPAGGGVVYLALRFYAPTSALSDGSWSYPVVEKVNVITGSSLSSNVAGNQQQVLDQSRGAEL
ncbi:hypothetical protein N7471_013709 [Penicillium samsonianum]|uniref:uncharacterized protein n=1 Tax=Penicillium samsonianum TaxID=1882272 RepID=UPI002546FF3D|nr:uncharacterized protein N7471_013709 [Penicillium samsonianum]KAJ6118242.1 hypothetical protein N7471_013709 [Penicillium samsonianum]